MGTQAGQKVFDVTIAGLSLKLRSSHDEETVKKLVDYVNEQLSEALPKTKSGSLQTAAMLACLNIAEELMSLKIRAVEELSRFDKRAQKILSKLESSKKAQMGLEN